MAKKNTSMSAKFVEGVDEDREHAQKGSFFTPLFILKLKITFKSLHSR